MEKMPGLDIITLQETPEERNFDFIPKTFDDYLGQQALKEKLEVTPKRQKCAVSHLIIAFFWSARGW